MRKITAFILIITLLLLSSLSVLADKIQIGPNQPETIDAFSFFISELQI
jgi:hypothetical protein